VHSESLIIKDLIRQWVLLSALKGQFKTQCGLAQRLRVSQQYVSKIAKWALWHCLHNETGRTDWQRTTLEELDKARERRLGFDFHPEPNKPSGLPTLEELAANNSNRRFQPRSVQEWQEFRSPR
jgi:hypothetical protein